MEIYKEMGAKEQLKRERRFQRLAIWIQATHADIVNHIFSYVDSLKLHKVRKTGKIHIIRPIDNSFNSKPIIYTKPNFNLLELTKFGASDIYSYGFTLPASMFRVSARKNDAKRVLRNIAR